MKNSVTVISESVFIYSILISCHTDRYHDDRSYSYVHHIFAPSQHDFKPAFSFILFLKILKF